MVERVANVDMEAENEKRNRQQNINQLQLVSPLKGFLCDTSNHLMASLVR